MTDTLETPELLKDNFQDIEAIDMAPGSHIEWGADANDDAPMIIWHENLEFHLERFSDLTDEDDQIRNPIDVLGLDNPKFGDRLTTLLHQHVDPVVDFEPFISVDTFEALNEFDPYLIINIGMPIGSVTGEETLQAVFDRLSPAIDVLFNVTDPGTFGSTYIFGELVDETANA